MKQILTLVVLANGSRAKYYLNEGSGKGLKPLPQFNFEQKLKRAQDIQADKPGRSFDSGGSQRHGMEYSSDPRDHERLQQAHKISENIEKAFNATNINRIVIACSPKMLSLLKSSLPARLSQRVYAEITKDLTQLPESDLPKHFSGVLAL